MKILMIDNYDSFTYNLVHYLKEIDQVEVEVIRNDKVDLTSLSNYDKIMLSPGPGIPSEAGSLLEVIKLSAGKIPLMGVCLGHQAIAEVFGGELENMSEVYHGLAHEMTVTAKDPIYNGLPEKFKVGRYHSWQVKNNKELSDNFIITAVDEENRVMSIRHKEMDIVGVQYHPESVLTEHGKQLIANWIK